MCGINVIIGEPLPDGLDRLQQMQDLLYHRGPDQAHTLEKTTDKASFYFGATRLRVIDQNQASDQPLLSDNGRYALLFNGEIYNYDELKNQLLHDGIRFKTASDTEVVLQWLIQYGQAGLNEFNGMFAIAFIDLQTGSSFIARDSSGIKPLFYSEAKGHVVISSESRGILSSGLIKKDLNKTVIPHYLSFKYAPSPQTFYRSIYKVSPGEIRSYLNGKLASTAQIDPSPNHETLSLNSILVDAVSRTFTGISNPGLMLSGGVDSTLLLALLNKGLGFNQVNTYTLAYTNHGKPIEEADTHFAKKAALQYHARHHQIEISEVALQRLSEFVDTIDQPVADSGAFATWLLAEQAAKDSNTLLSGAGADELFAGYNRHHAFHFYLKHRNAWWFPMTRIGALIPSKSLGMNQIKKFSKAIGHEPQKVYQDFLTIMKYPFDLQLWDSNNKDHLDEALSHDLSHYLVDDVLSITDQATMAWSIETRVPYLDQEVISFASKQTGAEKLAKGRKWQLRQMLDSFEGGQYTQRRKVGFGLPTNHWFQNSKNDYLWDFMNDDAYIFELVDKSLISDLLDAQQSKGQNQSLLLWSVLILNQWLAKEFS